MWPSIPIAVSTAVSWFERTAGIPDDEQLMGQQFPQMVMKELTRKLEQNCTTGPSGASVVGVLHSAYGNSGCGQSCPI